MTILILVSVGFVLDICALALGVWWQRRAHKTNLALLMSIEEYARQVRNTVRPPDSIYDRAIAAGRVREPSE